MARRKSTARKWVAPILLGVAALLAFTGPSTDARETPLNLTVEGVEAGGIGGMVSASEGMAVPDARLTFFMADGAGSVEFIGRAFTDLYGRYDFILPLAGCYSVVVDTPAGNPTGEIHSMSGGFCVGDAGDSAAQVDLS
ncbi:MAG: hypothetical protein AAF531_26370 [Actinomycetota bacterium]